MQILGVIPHFKLQINTQTTTKQWKMRCRVLTCFGLTCLLVWLCWFVFGWTSSSGYRLYNARAHTHTHTNHACIKPTCTWQESRYWDNTNSVIVGRVLCRHILVVTDLVWVQFWKKKKIWKLMRIVTWVIHVMSIRTVFSLSGIRLHSLLLSQNWKPTSSLLHADLSFSFFSFY